MYLAMVIAGGILWAVMSVLYYLNFKKGVKARRKFASLAYVGLALLLGGAMELFKSYLAGISPLWIICGMMVFIHLTAKIYIFPNMDY
jgi:hypothetical protein